MSRIYRTCLTCCLIILMTVFVCAPTRACTTAVISGKATKDGRPLLWKNRDFSIIDNELATFQSDQFHGVAVFNKGSRKSIWMGVNNAGLCIENSLSKDLSVNDAKGLGNGSFMLKALKTCATAEDVVALLKKTDIEGRSTNANFGIIDAHGAALLVESGATSHRVFDANDPLVAPQGIIVRSNFSMTGQSLNTCDLEKISTLYSSDRYLRAHALLMDQDAVSITAEFLLRNCAKDMADDDGNPFPGSVNSPEGVLPDFIPTDSTISRSSTVSAVVFQGVLPGENPELTTMWTMLGDPKFSIAVPAWPMQTKTASELSGEQGSRLCTQSLELRAHYFDPAEEGIYTDQIHILWEQLTRTESYIFKATTHQLDNWRRHAPTETEVIQFHESMVRQADASLARHVKRLQTQPTLVSSQQPADAAVKDEEVQ